MLLLKVKPVPKASFTLARGNGSIADPTEAGLKDAVKNGVIVVRSARVPNGPTTVSLAKWKDGAGFLESDTLNPQKARFSCCNWL